MTPPTAAAIRPLASMLPQLAVVAIPGCGRGVVTLRPIARGERIERAPVIELTPQERAALGTTRLARYYIEWGPDSSHAAIVLGYGSLYNHSFEPNAEYEFHEQELAIEYTALRDIASGEEITINYNNTGEDAHEPIRFD